MEMEETTYTPRRYTITLALPTRDKQWTRCYNVVCSESGVVRFYTWNHSLVTISGTFIIEEEHQNEAS